MSTRTPSPLENEIRSKHLLHDLAQWRRFVRSATRIDVDPDVKRKLKKDNLKRLDRQEKRTKWVPSKALPVSTFGKAPRVDPRVAAADQAYNQRLHEGTAVDLDANSAAAAVSVGKAVTISTAPRWSQKTDDVPSPDPASYTPRPVRPQSASARLMGRNGQVVLHKGMNIIVSPRTKQVEADNSGERPVESETAMTSTSTVHGVTFPKAPRFGSDDMGSITPGPAAYSYQRENAQGPLLSKDKRTSSATLSGPGREQPTVVRANSLFYGTKASVMESPGVGKYNVDSSSLSRRGVSIPKSGRSPSPVERVRPQSARPTPRRASAVASESNSGAESARVSPMKPATTEDPNSIAARLRSRSPQRFNKADARKDFTIVKGQIIYNLRPGGQDIPSSPGVGAYVVKDGKALADSKLITPRRPQSARSHSSRRVPRNEEPLPGPGQYLGVPSQFEVHSFNRFLRASYQHRHGINNTRDANREDAEAGHEDTSSTA